MNTLEIIKMRRSVRSFEKREIEEPHRVQIEDSFEGNRPSPFGNEVRFSLMYSRRENPTVLRGLDGALGTYGFIKQAQAFAFGAVKNDPLALCDYGYGLEQVVLEATSLGVGSCWLGGSFRPGPFGKHISVREGEVVPAVIALGYPGDRRRVVDRLIEMHHYAGNRRADWSTRFFEQNDFEISTRDEGVDIFRDLCAAVYLAPSSCNTQPWRLVQADPGVFHLFFARNRKYSKKDRVIGNADLQWIDMGIAMCHFERVARELKMGGGWVVLEDSKTAHVPKGVEYVVSWAGE